MRLPGFPDLFGKVYLINLHSPNWIFQEQLLLLLLLLFLLLLKLLLLLLLLLQSGL